MGKIPVSGAVRGKSGSAANCSGRRILHIALIVLLGMFAYSNTFHAPFQWDDAKFVRDNPIIKDLDYFLEPSNAEGLELYGALKRRYTGYLTFALNYKLHGLNVTGYHVFNLVVHILNALLVYLLVMLTFKTPFLDRSSLRDYSGHIALFSALLFVSHPIQTEAVTYIFQRLASFAAFFYLLSLAAYAGSRLSRGNIRQYALYALSLVSAVLAMKTKENTFTLPFVIMLYEFFFFRDSIKGRVFRLLPFLLTLFIIPLALAGIDKPAGEIMGGIGPASRGFSDIPRTVYLYTQFRVIVTYMRLLFLPVNQNIDYDYPAFLSLSNPQVFLSLLLLLSVFGLGVWLFYRSRSTQSVLRLVSFGIFWFFITLSVESSVIPLHMVINEYRVYLPSAGVFMAVTSGAFLLMRKLENKKIQTVAISFFILIPLVFSYATYARNSVWTGRTSLWEDVVRKSPGKVRGYNNLGNAYMAEGLIDEAIKQYRTALKIEPACAEVHNNLGAAYDTKGLIDRAIEHYRSALKLRPGYAAAHFNLGLVYYKKGLTEEARREFKTALQITPGLSRARRMLEQISKNK